jgi:glycosyltransferase involved in cell wall biosynthesis
MRIMHIISRYNRGGTATWLNNLINEQRSLGDQVFLLAGKVQNDEIEDDGFNRLSGIHINSLGKNIALLSDLKAFFELRSQIIKLQPDLVNTHTSKAGLLGRLAAFTILNNKPAIVHTYHGHILYGYYGNFATNTFAILEKIISYITDVFIVSGERVKSDLENKGIIKNRKVVVIRPGVEIHKSTDHQNKINSKNELTVGWLGRLTKIKQPQRVLELAAVFPTLQFLIGGEGELNFELRKISQPNVKLLGWVNPIEFWQKCDIALLTSDNEAQPISIIEAALCSLPCIAENVGSVSDVITDGDTGLLVRGFHERQAALVRLINDPELRLRLGTNAFKFASKKFSMEQFIKSHQEAYNLAIMQKTNKQD